MRWDKSHTNSMHLAFYPTRRDERQEKEEQRPLHTDYVLGISQAKNLTEKVSSHKVVTQSQENIILLEV